VAARSTILIAATQTESGRKLAMSVAAKVDGLVVLARSLPDEDVVTISRTLPVVLLAGRLGAGSPDRVMADNRGGARAITEHLITAHAITELAFLAGPDGSPDSDERFAGFREALRAAGLPVPRRPAASGGFTESGGEQAVRRLLAGGARPRAIVCGNDEMALGALTALRAARLRVPSEVAVTGFDDIAAARHVRPALTTVRQPMRALGERSVGLLLDRITEEPAQRGLAREPESKIAVLPVEPVIRRSCGCRDRGTAGQSKGPDRR
jgi:LacI family transcriptional regulator